LSNTIHIIGGGLAGLSCAVNIVKKENIKINLYEASSLFGGRCRSYKEKDFNCFLDNGNHLIIKGYTNTFNYLKKINAEKKLLSNNQTFYPFIDIKKKEKWEVRPYSFILPWWIFFKSYRPINVSFIDFIKSFKLIFAKRNQTVSDIIKKNSLIYRSFWKPFTIAVLNTHPNEASAKLLFNVIIKTLFFRNDPLKPYITKKSLDDSLIKPAIKKILSKKIKIKTKSRLKKIIFKNNFAEKIIINNDIIKINKKDLVILAVTPNIISRIIPKFKVPKKTNCILNIHFKLNQIHKKIKLPNNSFFVGIIGGTIDWIFKKKNILSITISAANNLNKLNNEEISEIVWSDVKKVFNLENITKPKYKIIREKMATFVQSPNEIYKKPKMLTQYKNIFLAGDWIDTGLPATIEGAITSGYNIASYINNN
tara:strand:+ start:9615 stop:10883 length:1269 start_codon:yes stop_codon:yes gene_type:complete